jgi:hypothetical protein
MATPRKGPAPAGYVEIEAALRLLEAGDVPDVLIARRLEALDHPAAGKAAALLRAGRWRAAANQLEFALEALAGPPDARALAWFKPRAEAGVVTPRMARAGRS